MDPKKLVEDEKKPSNTGKILDILLAYYDESKAIRSKLEYRWTKNQKLVKGIPVYSEREHRSVTKRPKIRFRKVWSSAVRLLSSLYQAFLFDKNKFQVRGFDELNDWKKAKILQKMTEYRLGWLFRRRDGFVKFIWAFMDCISPGTSVIKVHWKFNDEQKIDEPVITTYPLEQTCLDWSASTVSEMRYAGFENYLTEQQLEEMGYDNIDQAVAVELPQSTLRDTRFHETGDPLRSRDGSEGTNYQNGTVGLNFPAPGTAEAGRTVKDFVQLRYRALECFWKQDGKIYFGVVNPEGKVWLQKPMVSPYGTIYPVAVGSLLLEAHKLIPESIVEPLEGPQEDLNMTMNLRKDNQLLAMMGGWSIDKYGGVDRQALSNLKPGFIVSRNSGQGVIEPIKLPDVTQTSYVEANADQTMIEEMTGITPVKQGQTNTDKTGVARINLMESNAKEQLFTAIVRETLFKQVIYLLAYQIQLFETDERIFKVANESLRKEKGSSVQEYDNIYDVEFDMDVQVDVGTDEASRAVELQRLFAFIDRSLQSNNAIGLLMKSGVQIPNPTIVDTSKALQDIAEKLEIDDFQKYIIPITPPPPQGQELAQGAAGAQAPQPNAQGEAPGDFEQFMQQMSQ